MPCSRLTSLANCVAASLLFAGCSMSDKEVFTIYDSSFGPAKGWSHIATHPDRFPLLALENRKYAVDERSMVAGETSFEKDFFRTVLVRKVSNWGQQHANGIEPVFFDTPLAVSSVESVTLRFKLNASDSTIPSLQALKAHYSGHLSEAEVEQLDEGVPCLGLTFVEAGYNDQSVETLNAVYSLQFDPEGDYDRWLEITIPLSEFTFGFEKNYSMRQVSQGEVRDRKLVGFRINPETTSGKVARNFMGEGWDDTVPEIYKELSISLESVQASLRKGGE